MIDDFVYCLADIRVQRLGLQGVDEKTSKDLVCSNLIGREVGHANH